MTMLTGEKVLMRIFISEKDRMGHLPLHEALLEFFHKEGFSGCTVIHGKAGYGAKQVIHKEKILRRSSHSPVILEVVDEPEKVDKILPLLDDMVGTGMVTLEKVRVVSYRHD